MPRFFPCDDPEVDQPTFTQTQESVRLPLFFGELLHSLRGMHA